jgi:cobaltochelatase CobS
VFDDSSWPEEMQQFIPSQDKFKDYAPCKEKLETFWIAYNMNDNVYASGPTGSGKSSFFEYWCSVVRQPFIRINGREDAESDILFGKMGVKDGNTYWEDGLVTEGYKTGAMVLLDEATVLPAGIMMGLQWALEDNGKLVLTDKPGSLANKTVEPHPATRIVMADNTRGLGDDTGAWAGTNVMNTAFLNRVHTFLHFNYLPLNEEVKIITNKFDQLQEHTAEKIIKFSNLVRVNYEQGELDHTISPRDIINLTRKALYLGSFGKALQMSWLEKFGSDDQKETIKGHYRTVFNRGIEE